MNSLHADIVRYVWIARNGRSAMNNVSSIDNPARIEAFLRRDAPLHIYELGDLDPFFWPHTTWWACSDGDEVHALAMLYRGSWPCLIALDRATPEGLVEIVAAIGDELPDALSAHLSPGIIEAVHGFAVEPHGHHYKMQLKHEQVLKRIDASGCIRFSSTDSQELEAFYAQHYPGNWFDKRMLQTGQYFGIRDGDHVVCVSGVHVYAPAQGVAALGNIATAVSHRGRGLARRATAALCGSLLQSVDTIGLNVHCDNFAAIRCYQSLGFEIVADYDEFVLRRDS